MKGGVDHPRHRAPAALPRILGHHVAIDAKHLLQLLLPVTDQAFVRPISHQPSADD
jgi:hypothetical protein